MPSYPTNDFSIFDPDDTTKLWNFDLSGLSGGVGFNRTLIAADYGGYVVLADAESVGGQQILFNYGGVGSQNVWGDPDFYDSVFRISDQSDTSKKLALQISGITSTTIRTWSVMDLSGAVPMVGDDDSGGVDSGSLGKVALTSQSANISTTNLSNSPPTGGYLVCVYLQCTTADATAGNLTTTIGWTDINGAQTDTTVTHTLTSTTNPSRAVIPIQVSSGNITYAVSNSGAYNAARYAIGIRVIYLGPPG